MTKKQAASEQEPVLQHTTESTNENHINIKTDLSQL